MKDGVVYFIDLGMVGRMSSHDRGIVKDMIYAVASGDVPKLKDSLMRFAVTRGDSSELDHSTFLTDLDFIVADFASLDLKDLDIGEFLTSLISLARKNDVELPSVVTMFARGMVTLEGLLTEYMPDVNMIEIITDHIRHEKSSYRRAQEAAEELAGASYRALKGHLEMAEQLGLASRMLTRGQLKMNMQVLGSEQVLRRVGGIVDRMSMAIVIAGLFIGSSVVYYAKIEPVIFGIPVIGFLGIRARWFWPSVWAARFGATATPRSDARTAPGVAGIQFPARTVLLARRPHWGLRLVRNSHGTVCPPPRAAATDLTEGAFGLLNAFCIP